MFSHLHALFTCLSIRFLDLTCFVMLTINIVLIKNTLSIHILVIVIMSTYST